jgi:hypothetical protein
MSPDKARACIGVVWEMAGDVRQCDWRDSWEATPKSPSPVQVNDAPSTFSILPITTLDRISSTLARVPGTCMNDQLVTANRPDRPTA